MSTSSGSSSASSETIKLVSNDGKVFEVSLAAAQTSGMIKSMLEAGNFAESVSKEVKLDEIKGDVLAKVVDYMNFKLKYTGSTGEIPEFPLDAATVIDLWVAANFLEL
eukprot:TRINITY_DN11461_c0_g1_i1.p1 TRINITY_DN11461_c0_g1~~TRINITY_DN11461_c0_g1_i1.p1  ORF type:complete len:108 (-),score=41.30 TRINITY_DN11461_c0_g1_i1:31-354(-)